MRKRLILLLVCYLAFYYLIHIIYDMPNWVHGNPHWTLLPSGIHALSYRTLDTLFNFLFAFIPYYALVRWYPSGKWPSLAWLLVALPLIFLLPYFWGKGSLAGISRSVRLRSYFQDNISYTLISLIFGVVFFFVRYAWYRELRQKELELQSRRSELSFLRSQINPHFLFNSLNNIYSLVYQRSDQALTAIAGLSDLLRYMLYDTNDLVPLEKEIDYIRKYIDLQRVRFDHPIRAGIRIEGDIPAFHIAPLLLIPFVENAFKHGDFGRDSDGIDIVLLTREKTISFHCSNRKGTGQKDPGGGIGLENVRRRLALLYPGRHTLTIDDGLIHFTINLQLTHE